MIVPVKKVRILVAKSAEETLIQALQLESKFMPFEYNDEVSLPSNLSNELKAIERGIEALSKHEKKKFFAYHEVTRSEFDAVENDAQQLLSVINENLAATEAATKAISKLKEEIKLLTPYLNISVATKELDELVKTKIVIGYVPLARFLEFSEEVTSKGHIFEESSRDGEYVYGAFGYELVYENQATLLLNAYRFNEVTLPLFTTPLSKLLPELQSAVSTNEALIADKSAEIKALSAETYKLRAYYDYFYNKALRALTKTKTTERVAYIEGWVREDELAALKTNLNTKLECDVEELVVNDEELVPTATKNNKFVQQFESITNMFSVPNPKELDPNPVMSIWYWIIFGIMMGDVGYGLLMLIFFVAFIKLKRPKGAMLNLVMIFAFSSVPAIIFGLLTGGFFGYTFDLLNIIGNWVGKPGWSSIILQPVDDPMPMLIFSLVLGIFHIISGLILKIINEARRGDIKTLLADGVSWIAILVGLIVTVVGMVVLPSPILQWTGLGLVGVGVILILVLAGRAQKSFIGKAFGGLGGLYGATSYLSDVLSYSRILALSLSSAVIAFTMNLLADMVFGVPFVGFLLGTIVLIIGHLFNFVMGLLSAYVHDGRLQYLEFFGKFYEGGGYEFVPFTYKLKYIDEIKEE